MENEFKNGLSTNISQEKFDELTNCTGYLILQQLVKSASLSLKKVNITTLHTSGDNGSIQFRAIEYPDWQFGIWVIDKESNEDIIIHVFGTPVSEFGSSVGSMFTPWSASFCSSMSIERDEFNKSLCNLCVINRFIDYLKMINNSGMFKDWIFNKKTVVTWDTWDIAHDHCILWYSIKNFIKKIFTWKRTKKSPAQKKLLLD